MQVKIIVKGREYVFDPTERVKVVEYSPEAITAVRGLFYVMRAIKGVPRIYGLPKEDPIESWKKEFTERLLRMLSGEMETTKVYPQIDFEVLTESLRVYGGVKGTGISVKAEVLKAPQVTSQGAYAMLQVDSELQKGLVKMTPFILPAERVGFFYAFSRFIFTGGEERPSGIPKSLGIAAEFINGLIIVGDLRVEAKGMQCKGSPVEEVQCDGLPVNSLTPDVIDTIIFKIASSLIKEGNLLIVELPELYKTSRETKELLSQIRANLVLVTEEPGIVL